MVATYCRKVSIRRLERPGKNIKPLLSRLARSPQILQPLVAVAVLCVLVAAVSRSGGLPEPWGTRIGQNISRGGHFLFLLASLSALLFGPLLPGESRVTRLLMIGGALLGYLLVVEGLKAIVWLPRPDDYLRGTHGRGSGFPSGHTVPAFVVACLVADTYPRFRWAAFAMAVLIGYSRVEVVAHFAYQVAASGTFGAAIGIAVTGWRAQKISA